MPTRAAIFDFDGTIADSFNDLTEVYDQVAIELGLRRMSKTDFEPFRNMNALDAMRAARVPTRKIPRLLTAMRAGMRERAKKLRPFDGMVEALRILDTHGNHCGILSSNSLENIQSFLQRHNLQMFDTFSCGTSFLGKAARLRKLVRKLGLPATNIFYIGDEIRDIDAANEVGIRSIAVSWGMATRTALLAARPTHIADQPDHLLAFLTENVTSLA